MSDFYAGLTALQENVVKTKEHVEGVRSALDTAKQNVFQYTTMVSPSADQLNRVVQFVGNTDSTYTHGYFYTCESDGSGGYQWTEIEFGSIGDFLEETTELPIASASNVNKTYLLTANQVGFLRGGIYQNQSDGETPPTYSWVLISSSNLTAGDAIDITNDQINVKVDNDTIHINANTGELSAVTATNNSVGVVTDGDGTSIGANGEVNVVNRLEEISALPAASASNEGKFYLLTGTQSGYQTGGTYACEEITPATDPKTYHWVLKSANPLTFDSDNFTVANDEVSLKEGYRKIFTGTTAQWNALTTAQKTAYELCNITDDEGSSDLPYTFGATVSLDEATSSTPYTFPSDGYLSVRADSEVNGARCAARVNGKCDLTAEQTVDAIASTNSMFVRKGMVAYALTRTDTNYCHVEFYPLV